MKKNALGFIAMAMALMGNVALAATQDTIGAIRSIDRCDAKGVVYASGSPESARTVGEKAYFRIRLENHNSYEIYQFGRTNSWQFMYGDLPVDPVQVGIKVGVFVSGRFTLADVLEITNDTYDKKPWFTDLICAYTVQPGDIATPMTLANKDQKEASNDGDTIYFLGQGRTLLTDNSSVQLRSVTHDATDWDTITTTNVCYFRYGLYWSDNGIDELPVGGRDFLTTSPGPDYTLFNAGIFIRAIDFASGVQYDDNSNKVWRAVMEGDSKTRTSLEDATDLHTKLYVPGPMSTNGYVYLWIEDTNSVRFSSSYVRYETNSTDKLLFNAPANSVVPFHGMEALKFTYSTDNLEFELIGVTAGTTTKLCLSSALTTNSIIVGTQTITNYLSQTVACVKSNPTLSVTAGGESECNLQASSAYANKVDYIIRLSPAWTNHEDVVVKFKYELNGEEIAASNLAKKALIAISNNQNTGYKGTNVPESVTIPDTKMVPEIAYYLYALDALSNDPYEPDTLVITPYFEAANVASVYKCAPLTIQLSAADPVVDIINDMHTDDSSEMEKLTASGGTESIFTLHVLDTYRNMARLGETNDGFTVTWTFNDKETVITNLTADSSGNLKVSIKYDNVISQQKIPTKVQITNADGRRSEVLSFNVTVNPPPSVSATVGALQVGEGSYLPVEFYINDAGSIPSPLYVYLEPANAAASNLSYAAFFTTTNGVVDTAAGPVGYGVPFIGGATNTVSTELDFEGMLENANRLTFFDNLDNTSLSFKYKIRLCRTPQWNPDELVSGFRDDELKIQVANTFPVINNFVAINNETGKPVPMSVVGTGISIERSLSDPSLTFRVNLDDVDLDIGGVESNQVVYSWEMYTFDGSAYPDKPDMIFYTVGTNSAFNMVDVFGDPLTEDICGKYKISVRAQDKDMRGWDKKVREEEKYFFKEGGVWTYNPWRKYGSDYIPIGESAYPEVVNGMPGNDWGDAKTFELEITPNPRIYVSPVGSYSIGSNDRDADNNEILTFKESNLLNKEDMGFAVSIRDVSVIHSKDQMKGVPIEVTITPVDDNYNAVVLGDIDKPKIKVANQQTATESVANFYLKSNQRSLEVGFEEFDGTWMGSGSSRRAQLYRLVAVAKASSNKAYNQYLTPSTNYFRLANTIPTIRETDDRYSEQAGAMNDLTKTNALQNTKTPNAHFAFGWEVQDVIGDLARDYTEDEIAALGPTNLIVTCEVDGGSSGGGYVVGAVTNQNQGTFSVWFEKSGFHRLTITAYDKDDPSNGYSKDFTFFVEPSKRMFLYPYGPSSSSVGSDEIEKYKSPSCLLGVGRVWSNGGFGSIDAYMHTWTYGASESAAKVYGEGYSAWQRDTSTVDDKSTAPKQNGSGVGSVVGGVDDRYVNKSPYDNFFYRWFLKEPGKNGSSSSSGGGSSDVAWAGGAPSPGKTSDAPMSLPMQENNFTYSDSSALAVFSREKYIADNMGDINGDGIPDDFATSYWTSEAGESKPLYAIVNGGESDGDDGSINDLADISGYNDDFDFLPMCWSLTGNPLKPTVFDWGPGEKFDALYEIRGIHLGLNEPGISDYDLSDAERYALLADYVVADPTNHILSGVLSVDYIAATNWATTVTNWTPEAWTLGTVGKAGVRLNPAKADTDGDGMDDGWEYYFWYYAKVGAVTNGVWGRLEGRRYDLAAPATGTRIAPEEIVKAFDPLSRRDADMEFYRDFDNDGLSDLEEYALGTNPIDWDSDGDGMNDLWEVMNGLDPLSLDDDPEVLEYDSTADINNMDRDFMARSTYGDDTFTVYTFANGEMYGFPTKSSPKFAADPVVTATNVYELVVEDPAGVTNTYYTVSPAAYDDSVDPHALTADAVAFESVTLGGMTYLKSMETITVTNGTTNVVSAAAETTRMTLKSFYYKADKVINSELKTEKIWFAEKPAVIYQFDTGLFQLATDAPGFTTYEHEKDVFYLGEARVFPAGTLLKAIANAPVQITQVNTPPYIETPFGPMGGFTWCNPETLETNATCKALPLFNYGGDGATYVPCSRKVDDFALAPVVEDEDRKLTRSAVVKVERKHKVTLIHNQVFNQYGFDPRTAWNIDADGYVDRRWHAEDSETANAKGDAGLATRTVPYNSRDEYLVMQYRQQMRAINSDGTRSYTESLLNGGSRYLIGKGEKDIPGSVSRFRTDTTYPNFPVVFVRNLYQSRQEVNPFDNSTNRTVVTYWTWLEQEHKIHGADTDYDGIPDGWELYVDADPNDNDDAKEMDGWSKDGDKLNLLKEYAGVDSCNAYTNRFDKNHKEIYPEAETITANNPGTVSGWWNKFFPTNPHDKDTDGDGLKDDAEGAGWKAAFYVGQTLYSPQQFTFIYGCKPDEANFAKYAADGKSICFRGGGLNPCTVDTDGDLLPDAWEHQFPGVLFENGEPVDWSPRINDANNSKNDLDLLKMADGWHTWGKQNPCSTSGYEIRGGMDGTYGYYNDKPHDGDASMDFDHDGLANCQEYLVQSLRHLRYDDPYTPLMGIHPGTKQFLKFIPFSAWDGEAFHKRCLAAGFTGLGTWKFSELGYFTLPPHKWDMLYQNTAGLGGCDNYADFEGKGYRIMLPPVTFLSFGAYLSGNATQYASTDPRRWDTDEDGMDDYYELFHGLNPLLGSAACPDGRDGYDVANLRFDVIAKVHNGFVTSWRNHWTGWPIDDVSPAFDPIRFPWMMGTMECDADGDGLRNDEESIKVNLAKPSAVHTDPTPLWMTDSSGLASYTAQYYNPDPYITEVANYNPLATYPDIFAFPWDELFWYLKIKGPGMSGAMRNWMFSFEENEGYDTDHDFKRDTVELSGLPTNGEYKVEMPSDPQVFCDPNHRQAIYFPGVNSAIASRDGTFTRAVSSEPDLLKQFTVELWVKPEGEVSNVMLVERVCNYGPSTLTYSNAILRANFRLGVDEGGHVYGEYEGSTENSGRVRVTAPSVLPANTWTHLALTYSGINDVMSLYVNGEVAPVATARGAGLIPANGIMGINQEYYTTVMRYGYTTLPCMTLFGARAKNGAALALDETTQWEDFDTNSFFKGWIDEVRVWDGARTPTEIHANYRKRFTMADIKLMRSRDDDSGIQGFYEQWFDWKTTQKSDPLLRASLPAELLQHYSFASLPGGVAVTNVLTEPVEFQKNVLGNVCKPNGATLKTSLKASWWSKTPVRSTVYTSSYVIPWIGNTVAHLPFLDGSSPDSQYWSEKIAGVMRPEDQGFTSYDYPNEANPYPYYLYRRDRFNRLVLLEAVEDTDTENVTNLTGVTSSYLAWKWRFQMRSEFLGTSDLVPLGGAYARRDTDFWDGQGAMDAWTETSRAGETADVNGNGIPDWAEALGYTTADGYLRALAEGLLPDGTKNSAFADVTDFKRDGVKDWWQKMYGLTGSAHNDTDQDGLPDFAEYLASEVFKFTNGVGRMEVISPLLAKSNGTEFDYFLRPVFTTTNGSTVVTNVSKLYLGELFCDHDHMEDGFEREWAEIGVDPAYYDAHLDSDEDGWSNWAEVRAKCDMGIGVAELDTSVTNVYYYRIPREDYAGYACYGDFKAMSDALNDLQTQGALIVEDAQFTTAGFGHIYEADSVKSLPGCPSGKNGEHHTDRYGTGWFKVRFISTPYGKTWRYRGHPTPNVSMTIHYNGIEDLDGRSLLVSAYTDEELKRADATFTVVNTRAAKVGENRNVNTLSFLVPDNGYLREGKNTFVVTVAPSNSTESTSAPAKPAIIGVARDVDVGWSKVEFDVELTEETPICPRPELAYSLEGGNTGSSSSSNKESAETGSDSSHVYVYRYAVDDYNPPSSLVNRLVLDKDIGSRTYLHEGDFLAEDVYDIDWAHFQSEVVRNPTVYGNEFPVTSVTYRVYSQPVDIAAEASSNATPYVEFTRNFGEMPATAVPVAPGEHSSIFYRARPTFVWRMTGDRPDTYTAFAIQILDAAGTTPIWNSGTQLAPPRNINGEYEWQAPLYPGDQTDQGKVFANTNNYTWRVTMYNAKFQSPAWSATRNFRMNVYAEDEVNIADTYGIRVAVKYFGPGSFNTAVGTLPGTLRVEAYTSPDFSGQPAGRTFVRDLTSVTNANHTVNAQIVGLKSGTYYVRAYIDSDGDFRRDDWESWGYACPRGDVITGSIFAPSFVTIGEGVEPPTVQVYVEDCDTDQDCLPDVWEYKQANGAADFLLRNGPTSDINNGYISVNPNLEAAISDIINGGIGNSIMLMSAGPKQMPKTLAALMLGTDSVDPSIDAKTLAIKSLTLADGTVTIALAAEADDPAAGTVFVTDGMVRATVVVKYADSLSGKWESVETSLEKKIEDGAVSEELTFSLEELGLDPTKGFFKVEVKQ